MSEYKSTAGVMMYNNIEDGLRLWQDGEEERALGSEASRENPKGLWKSP